MKIPDGIPFWKLTFSFIVVWSVVLMMDRGKALSTQSSTSLEGFVLEGGTELPLQNVRVLLSPGSNSAVTNSEGHFEFTNIPPARYRIIPERQGYVYSRPERVKAIRDPGVWIQANTGKSINDIQIHMVKSGVIAGSVTLQGGITKEKVFVYLLRKSYDDYGNRHLFMVPGISYNNNAGSNMPTDDRNQYRFFGLPPGEYYIGAVSFWDSSYYPGVVDEAKAIPIEVRPGEEVRLHEFSVNRNSTRQVAFKYVLPNDPSVNERTGLELRIGNFGITGGTIVDAIRAGNSFQLAFPTMRQQLQLRLRTAPGSPLFYSFVNVEAGSSDTEKEVTFDKGVQVTGEVIIENASGQRDTVLADVCTLRPDLIGVMWIPPADCFAKQFPRGLYRLELSKIPPDAYVLSAEVAGHDILADGLQLDNDSEINILLGASGRVVKGTVQDANGHTLPDSVVALVPDPPFRSAGPLFRSVISDIHGDFELHGIRPGSYRLFAWSDLDGAGYRNADFMKSYENRGKPIQIENDDILSVSLTAFESD